MKKIILSLSLLASMGLMAQNRYLDPVFSQVTTTSDIEYGVNIDFLTSSFTDQAQVGADLTAIKTALFLGNPIPATYYNPADTNSDVKVASLKYDVYEPVGDTNSARPLIIYVHTGNFLPPPLNGGPNGSKTDSAAIVLCEQWAQRGFVSMALNYRLGWNPVATTPLERRASLLNAVYRAIHDVKQLVRVIKEDAAGANTYKIDPNKIILYGQGSGGYVAVAYSSLDKHAELEIPKFLNPLTNTSYVDTATVGNIDGFGGLLNLYAPNGFSSDVHFTANAGGALADTSWLEAGDNPMVSFQAVRDPFAPFDQGIVIVPTTNEDVVEVQGANVFMAKANALGNNTYTSRTFTDVYTTTAQAKYGQTYSYIYPAPDDNMTVRANSEGLYPLLRPLGASIFQNQGSPWEWWDPSSPLATAVVNPGPPPVTAHQASLLSNPDMSPSKGRSYLDTIQGYMIPRIMVSLQLDGYMSIGMEENTLANDLSIYPNPANDILTVSYNKQAKIESIEIIDLTGRLVMSKLVDENRISLDVSALKAGVYLLRTTVEGKMSTTKISKF